MTKTGLQIGLALFLSLGADRSAPTSLAAGTEDVSNVLGSANEVFKRDYDRARREITSKLSPLIYCNGEVLTLATSNGRKTENMVPAKYTLLKCVDHIAVTAYIILANHVDETLAPEVLQNLQNLQTQSGEARTALVSAELDAELRERQYRIIDATTDFIAQVEKQGNISQAKLKQFAAGLSDTLMQNAEDGVAAQLALMNEIVSRWKKEMPEVEWNRLHVILTSGHMPRERLVTWQFFSDILNQKKEGDKIIIMEGIDDFDKGVDLLGTHMLDEKIAVDFFGDRGRMHKDLLSNGARLYLRKHRPGK
jgi:hypothetical protein